MIAVSVRHNFETGHRLPQLGGKCVSLHGHSWWVRVVIEAPDVGGDSTVIEFGALKAHLRSWVDTNLDHGCMLGATDPLCGPLQGAGCKVYQFGDVDPDGPHRHAQGLEWPTVENVAVLLSRVAVGIVGSLRPAVPDAVVAAVTVEETATNSATWTNR